MKKGPVFKHTTTTTTTTETAYANAHFSYLSLSLCIHPIRFVEWNGGKRERERQWTMAELLEISGVAF